MVDLGFLLISFFIFSTEISKPAVINLYMPHNGDSTRVADSKSLTFLLYDNDKVFYYYGNTEGAIHSKQLFQTTYNETLGLGNVIRERQIGLEKKGITRKALVIIIKPTKECCYKDVVNTLDEMLINEVANYSITDIGQDEESFIKALKH
jgi:hypothetical protein